MIVTAIIYFLFVSNINTQQIPFPFFLFYWGGGGGGGRGGGESIFLGVRENPRFLYVHTMNHIVKIKIILVCLF